MMAPRAVNAGALAQEDATPMQPREYTSHRVDEMVALIEAACDDRLYPRTPVVYFIQAGEGGPIKIGFCMKLEGVRLRILDLQTGCPWPLVVCRIMKAPERRQTEFALHRRFAKHRLAGEWFSPCDELVEFARARTGPVTLAIPLVEAYERGYAAGLLKGEADAYEDVSRELRRLANLYGGESDSLETVGNCIGKAA